MIFEVLAIAVLFAAVMWLSSHVEGVDRHARHKEQPAATEVEPDSTLTQAASTVGWAEGTRSDWDRHVRPVLAREFDNIVGARRSGTRSRRETGELMFGPRLWPLVDPGGGFTSGLGAPGPGRSALGEILEKLEAA